MGDITYSRMKIEDRSEVLDFLRRAYPDSPRQSDPEFWDWHYLKHPAIKDGRPPVWLAKVDGRVAGQATTRPVKLKVNSRRLDAAWLLDLIVDESHRRTGIGRELVSHIHGYQALLATPTSKQHSPALFRGLGWSDLGPIPRYQCPLFPANDVREIDRIPLLRSGINGVWRSLRGIKHSPVSTSSVREVNEIDGRFDRLFEDASRNLTVAAVRTSAELKWQFRDQPGKRYKVLGYFNSGSLQGYAVLFFRRARTGGPIAKGAISDILYHPDRGDDIVRSLIDACILEAQKVRCGGLVMDTTDPMIGAAAAAAGFWRVKSPQFLMTHGLEPAEVPLDMWHLTRADSDISIFEAPNE